MSGLPRDILKWLQSLDLSIQVKNPKRDFSNGFLVAEILSRYFPADVTMHSYDPGLAMNKKLDNWAQLEKVLIRKEIPIDHDLINRVIHNRPEGALQLLQVLFSTLTNRPPPAASVKVEQPEIPTFAKPTASQLVKDETRTAEMKSVKDIDTVNEHRLQLIQAHKEELRKVRAAEAAQNELRNPLRRSGFARNYKPGRRPMSTSPEKTAGEVQFKEVQVRSVDRQSLSLKHSGGNSIGAASSSSGREA